MTDASGSKTMASLLAIIMLGILFSAARLSRQDASASQPPAVDATTCADSAVERRGLPPSLRLSPTEARPDGAVVNRALREMEAIEVALEREMDG